MVEKNEGRAFIHALFSTPESGMQGLCQEKILSPSIATPTRDRVPEYTFRQLHVFKTPKITGERAIRATELEAWVPTGCFLEVLTAAAP